MRNLDFMCPGEFARPLAAKADFVKCAEGYNQLGIAPTQASSVTLRLFNSFQGISADGS